MIERETRGKRRMKKAGRKMVSKPKRSERFMVPVLVEDRPLGTALRVEKWRAAVAHDLTKNLTRDVHGFFAEIREIAEKVLRDHGA